MCLQIEAGIIEHIQVEVRSANNSIYSMYVFYFYLLQTYYFGLTDKSTEFPLFFNSRRMYAVKKKKLRNLFTAQLCISQLKPRFPGYSGKFLLFFFLVMQFYLQLETHYLQD